MASSNHGTGRPQRRTSISRTRSHSEHRNQGVSSVVRDSLITDLENDDALDISDSASGADTPEHDGRRRSSSNLLHPPREYSLANFYRRPSTGVAGSRLPFSLPSGPDHLRLSEEERERLLKEERGLLKESKLLPRRRDLRSASVGAHRSSSSGGNGSTDRPGQLKKSRSAQDEEQATVIDTENTPLLGNGSGTDGSRSPDINLKWEEAVLQGLVQTSWQREAKVLARNSAPLIVTFLLQYSLNVTSIFTVGRLGKMELGAVSLATMTANITGYSVYHGLVTSLDTLCAQAYGSGRRHLVGLQLQRMICFLIVITVPIAVIWFNGTAILKAIVPEQETAELAGLYLKIIILGAPGYACFEAGKRYMQAQGLFDPVLYVLVFLAPFNVFLNWLFVWHLGWGFVGAPIAVTVTDNLLPIFLFLYVFFIDGRQCWGGFSRAALMNWWPMIKLALPGLIMVLAEFLAFEILTLAASHISGAHLAAQSVLSTIAATAYQLPFPVSIAASTRIANLIGATLTDAAKSAARVSLFAALLIGATNITILFSARHAMPYLFTKDPEVAAIVAGTLPLCIAFQVFDALAAVCNGILRGLGRQEIGGYVNLFSYYVIAMPISFGTGFYLHWDLNGLWLGPAIALMLVGALEGIFIWRTSWDRAVEEARVRNAAG